MDVPPFINNQLQFLKLGGSLITDKSMPLTFRRNTMDRLADEIGEYWQDHPERLLVLGHGSGSFGHQPAQIYGTRQGVRTPAEWQGFTRVWQAAQALNHLVLEALVKAGLPAIAFSPLASILAEDGRVLRWNVEPVQRALQGGLLPVIYGDVVFDIARGGTILSTEDLFFYLAGCLFPQRILLAGIEPGVWSDFPACTKMLPEITPGNIEFVLPKLGGAIATDVTGGMASKVNLSLGLGQAHPGLEVLIFSGEVPGTVGQALGGASPGTRIHT
jgi:isopentenyl phosphate kinase